MDIEQSSSFSESPIEKAVNKILIIDKEQNKFDKARKILGESGKEINDEQLENYVSEFEYLANCWLEIFERQVFEGKTLEELLRAK